MILIAEDNPGMRRILRTLVEEVDSEIIECVNGTEAVDAYLSHRPDWVLMDINMSPVDGLTAMGRILEFDPLARIVIITHHNDARTRETAMEMGATAFIGKADLMAIFETIPKFGTD